LIIDTSALLAILQGEPEAAPFASAIIDARDPRLPACAFVEATLKRSFRILPELREGLDRLVTRFRIEVVPFTADHAQVAADARRRFGSGPNALNFGDCMVYAVAKLAEVPLLYKGVDFAQTDVPSALA